MAWYVVLARRPAPGRAWAWPACSGSRIAAIGVTSPTRAVLRDLIAAWPGFAVLRDGQQFVAALALVEAIGLGAGASWLLGRAQPSPGRGQRRGQTGCARSLPPSRSWCWRCSRRSCCFPAWPGGWPAGSGRCSIRPTGWQRRQIIDSSAQRGSVLLLPWAAYRRYPWNHGEAVYDPWNKLLSREVISNDGLEVGTST